MARSFGPKILTKKQLSIRERIIAARETLKMVLACSELSASPMFQKTICQRLAMYVVHLPNMGGFCPSMYGLVTCSRLEEGGKLPKIHPYYPFYGLRGANGMLYRCGRLLEYQRLHCLRAR